MKPEIGNITPEEAYAKAPAPSFQKSQHTFSPDYDELKQGLECLKRTTVILSGQLGWYANLSDEMKEAAEMLWVVIANVSGGEWQKQTPEWQAAARRWVDNYHAVCSRYHLKTA